MPLLSSFFFFFNDTATTEIYTLSLHDALPICLSTMPSKTGSCTYGPSPCVSSWSRPRSPNASRCSRQINTRLWMCVRSEEHTSELQSRLHLVCRLLLEKKKEP